MAYISSDKIRVFPSVGRSNYDIESQLMNENNISQIVRSLCRSRKDYVLSTELSTGPFEFVIYGFYFKILDASNTLSSITSGEGTKEVWAGIKIDANAEANNTSSNYQLLQLANTSAENNEVIELDAIEILDKEDKFQGIIFGTTEDEVNGEQGENYHTLRLLVKDGDTFKVPAQSLLHIKSSEVLDGDTDNYINSVFTTNDLTCNNSIKSNGTLAVTGVTTLNTLSTQSNTSIGGTLNVTGETTLSTLTANNTQIKGTLNVEGATTLASVTATFVSAPTFSGSLSGNATTATNFNSSRKFTFSDGDISGSADSSTGGYTIAASIIDDHVTEAKIKDDAVTTNKIKDSNITTSKIDNGAVTNDKIANNAVTTNKIEDANVTTSKIADSAVTNDKIENETIKVEKLGFDLNMILKVEGEDDSHKILIISLPTLNNKK